MTTQETERENGSRKHFPLLLAGVTSSLCPTHLALVWRGGGAQGLEPPNGLWEQLDLGCPTWVLPQQLLSLSQREVGKRKGSVCSLPCHHLLPRPAGSSSAGESIEATTCRKGLLGKPVCSEPGLLPAKTLHKHRRRSQEIFFFFHFKINLFFFFSQPLSP